MQQRSAAQQVQLLTNNLRGALARKAELLEQLENVNVVIKATREAIGGVQLGQKLEQEAAKDRQALAEVPPTYNEALLDPRPDRVIQPTE